MMYFSLRTVIYLYWKSRQTYKVLILFGNTNHICINIIVFDIKTSKTKRYIFKNKYHVHFCSRKCTNSFVRFEIIEQIKYSTTYNANNVC